MIVETFRYRNIQGELQVSKYYSGKRSCETYYPS